MLSCVRRWRQRRRELGNWRKLEEWKRLRDWKRLEDWKKLEEWRKLAKVSSALNPSSAERKTQDWINLERMKRGIPPVRWDDEMYRFAKGQAAAMQRVGRLFHSGRFALRGGENCFQGTDNPRRIVKGWMSSDGHRAWLLDRRVRRAAVGIAGKGHQAFVAWSFHE